MLMLIEKSGDASYWNCIQDNRIADVWRGMKEIQNRIIRDLNALKVLETRVNANIIALKESDLWKIDGEYCG